MKKLVVLCYLLSATQLLTAAELNSVLGPVANSSPNFAGGFLKPPSLFPWITTFTAVIINDYNAVTDMFTIFISA